MKMWFYFSIIFLSLISCVKKNDSTVINPVASVDTSKTYLALGDSYTIGQSVSESESYPFQTVDSLRLRNIQIKNPVIIATTGWTTHDLINALDNNPPATNYSIVTLLIGVNNQYQHQSLEEYKTEFTQLLNRSIKYAANDTNHVLVLSIPDYSVTPYAAGSDTAEIAKEIDEFNEANKAISLQAGVQYIDITPLSREARYDPSLIAGDGLHPSASEYAKWSALLAPAIQKELR